MAQGEQTSPGASGIVPRRPGCSCRLRVAVVDEDSGDSSVGVELHHLVWAFGTDGSRP
jgi:hypothetical protein